MWPLTLMSGLMLSGVALVWIAGGVMVRGRSAAIAPATSPAQDFWIASKDGVSLAATYRPGRRTDSPGVLLLHGVDASRGAVADNAAWLGRQGYATLAIDFRGHGESTARPRSFGWNEAVDAHAAFGWLKHRQRGAKVAVIGISMGGAASLIAPSGPLPADAMILQAVYPDIRHAIRDRIADRLGMVVATVLEPLLSFQARPRFGVWPSTLSPIQALSRVRTPVMVIGGMQDRYTPPGETRALFARAPRGDGLWLVPQGDHAAICALNGKAYRARVAAFLNRSLGSPATSAALPTPTPLG